MSNSLTGARAYSYGVANRGCKTFREQRLVDHREVSQTVAFIFIDTHLSQQLGGVLACVPRNLRKLPFVRARHRMEPQHLVVAFGVAIAGVAIGVGGLCLVCFILKRPDSVKSKHVEMERGLQGTTNPLDRRD
ncbi:MAG: hypothetical protein A2289_15915 [Deltaproteobacteria bacterium RIFOXYA12_FULL_58_15]|nr:MAG: hypothetical protein A2289_15915 [Deltaproteobacteria bacterium RIFOXYA12_FULL_58_15]